LAGVIEETRPEIILLPWFLDKHPHHRETNRIFAAAARGVRAMVLGYEIWGLLNPNAFFDITELQKRKRELIEIYASQLLTVDYLNYAEGLARARAFHLPVRPSRGGAVEAFLALPCHDYCDFARHALKVTDDGPLPTSADLER